MTVFTPHSCRSDTRIPHNSTTLDLTRLSNLWHAKLSLSAIYRETGTPATHVHGMRHGATSTGGLRRRYSNMGRKFRYIKYATYAAKFGLGGFTRNQQPLTIKTKHVSHTDRTKAERAQEEDAEQDWDELRGSGKNCTTKSLIICTL